MVLQPPPFNGRIKTICVLQGKAELKEFPTSVQYLPIVAPGLNEGTLHVSPSM